MPNTSELQRDLSKAVSKLRNLLPRARNPGTAPARGRGGIEDIEAMTKRVILPSLPVSDEELARAGHQERGLRMARQELWNDLSEKIRYADDARLATPGGEPASLLLAAGARGDVVAAAVDALFDGAEPDEAGLEAFENMHREMRDDYGCALVVALAHLDIGCAWRNLLDEKAPGEALTRFRSHLDAAERILDPFDGVELDAPSVAAARCSIYAACEAHGPLVADEYEKLIDLDPDGHRHMRALGRDLLPPHAGGLSAIELEARRAAVRTAELWGAGAYAWVYFDALALEHRALDLLDAEFFAEGLRDIAARKRDQHIINMIAAFCAITMAPPSDGPGLSARAEGARAHLHECLDWVLQDHLQELHPLIWSQALLSPGQSPLMPSNRALVQKGRQTALRIIAERFASDIADGSSIAFSPAGMYRLPAL